MKWVQMPLYVWTKCLHRSFAVLEHVRSSLRILIVAATLGSASKRMRSCGRKNMTVAVWAVLSEEMLRWTVPYHQTPPSVVQWTVSHARHGLPSPITLHKNQAISTYFLKAFLHSLSSTFRHYLAEWNDNTARCSACNPTNLRQAYQVLDSTYHCCK